MSWGGNLESARVKALLSSLGEDVEACEIGDDVECLNKVTDIMDRKLTEMRNIIEVQKRHHAFKTYSYPSLDKALKEIGY